MISTYPDQSQNQNLPQICPHCQKLIPADAIFCPNCGKAVREAPLSTSFFKQLTIYAVSFLLPPFGLVWAVKYLKSSDDSAKKIGLVSVILTVLSIIINIYLVAAIFNSVTSQLSGLNYSY